MRTVTDDGCNTGAIVQLLSTFSDLNGWGEGPVIAAASRKLSRSRDFRQVVPAAMWALAVAVMWVILKQIIQ